MEMVRRGMAYDSSRAPHHHELALKPGGYVLLHELLVYSRIVKNGRPLLSAS
jgi:hypothetical protein